jgi:16S rRNA (uracil1498-N3)-methyltransferase
LIVVFNGTDGEWLAKISSSNKKHVTLTLEKQQRPQSASPDLWLLAAPLKNGRTETTIEQATELGISRFIPVATQFTVIDRINRNRLESIAIEAAEQSERMDIPHIEPLTSLSSLLTGWSPERRIIYGDESGAGKEPGELFPSLAHGKYAVLIGPEGGFSTSELAQLREIDYASGMCMGPRILRAGTAAIAALAIVQSWLGDWENKPAFRQI